MFHKILSQLDKTVNFDVANAHCDIPCKIYDPAPATIACLSLIRMVDLINEHKDGEITPGKLNKLIRFTTEKEKQGSILKDEIRIIWGDYFKAPQMEKFPEIHELTHSIMLLASKNKQEVDKESCLLLLEKVNRFAEIFWATKGIETKKAVSPYPPSLEVVYPAL